jgi:formate hydrogenlyase subunit 3/multisubunit Na+/H+ antiporter MnhD subunit
MAAGLGVLGFLAATLFVRPFLYAAIFVELSAALAVFMLTDEGHPVASGSLRFLTYTTLGMPFILFTGWLIESGAADPGDPRFLTQAAYFLAAGFAIWLGVVPFHSWLAGVAEHSPPLATAFVATVVRVPVVYLLLNLLDAYNWLADSALVSSGLLLGGTGMVVLGALFIFGQRNLGRSVGYALVIEFGAVLLALGLGTRAGVEAALATMALRGLGLWLWAVSLDRLQRAARERTPDSADADSFDALRGLGWRYPFAVTALAVGMLSVVGLPLMAGFPPRWALLRLLADQTPALAAILLGAMTSVGVVVMRALAALTTPQTPDEIIEPRETRPAMVAYSLGILAILLLGAFPQWVLPLVVETASFTRFGP